MSSLPFGSLSPYRPRQFIPADLNLGLWTQVAPWFDRLEARAPELLTGADLERWLVDWSELHAALDEEGARRYIAMTCHTEDADAKAAHLHWIEKIEPELKPRQFRLAQIFLKHPRRSALPAEKYQVFDRDMALLVELFREENVPLEVEENKLGQQYYELSGALTVTFRGEEKTLVQMSRYLEEPDRATRQEAWELVAQRRLREVDRFDDLFDQLLKLRIQIARNVGFANFRDFAFKQRGRFDYTPADCERFHEAIERHVLPLLRRMQARRREQLGLSSLRPWDLACDPLSRPPLRPFEQVDRMVTGTQRIFDRLDPTLADGFRTMQEQRLLDLDNRKGKAPGGYQSTLNEARLPFIFMNSVGLQRDVETMLHEAGHAFHALAAREHDLMTYRSAPIEFCEVASMSMELLGNDLIEEFYAPDEANRARRTHLESIIAILGWIAQVDAFQHWIYLHPEHTRAERAAAWSALGDRFLGDMDYRGYEAVKAHLWHRQLHIFVLPFYYIEYGIAQLGALQVWANARRDPQAALRDYQAALVLGGSRPLPELFAAAGCRFAFDDATLKPLMDQVTEEVSRLG